jgi:voltage-gated potassium channel
VAPVTKTHTQTTALERFEQYTALPMLVLALAFIPLLVIPFLVDLSAGWEVTFLALDWFIWAAFAVEYLIRLYLAPKKLEFMRRNVIDLLVVVLPFLRPLRFLRFGRAVRLMVVLARTGKAARIVLTRHKLQYVLLVALVVVIGAAALMVQLERGAPDRNIDSFAEALWWGVTTVTTVGYGDTYPVTAAGRGIAAVLMVLGIGIFGLLAASLAAYFIEQDTGGKPEDRLTDIQARLGRIEQRLRDMEDPDTTDQQEVTR